jgi:hypothetical protein
VSLRKFGVDDSEQQVEQEEGTSQDHGDENDEGDAMECPLHHALNVGPALEGHALEHIEQGILD